MILDAIGDVGPWVWILIGLTLLAIEVLAPGLWFLWFGSAALTVGALTLMPFTDVSWWPWQAQVVAFGVLSAVFVLVGRKVLPGARDEADPFNRPLDRMVGREAVLEEALSSGAGRVKLGDTLWRVSGPDLPAGTRVRVTGHDGDRLQVEAV